ncbi:hypothetical protein WJX84_000727 [Apatococcus fuscideae]|uniref:Nudix hydrolase domain-containing protein n=1 Tax=Apatococcus fuscideae TaxID=2026836 RepID=A0AAW1SWY7_9CHLO
MLSSLVPDVFASNPVQQPKEQVQIVDENNQPIGSASRKDMREQQLLHRCSFVITRNSQEQVLVQKRVHFKEIYPSFYDPAPGGVVGAGESYEKSAAREIEEEMGISGVSLVRCFEFLYRDKMAQHFGGVFSCVYDGPLRLDPQEVESAEWWDLQDVKKLLQDGPVSPDSKIAFERYLKDCCGGS